MNRIYTYVGKFGDSVLERGVDEEGNTFQTESLFEPYLFQSTNSESIYKGLDGKNLTKIAFDNSREMSEYTERYKDVSGHDIYGMRDVVSQYISETYPTEVKFNMSKIYGGILDIEVFSGHYDNNNQRWVFDGFPKPEKADKPVNAITFYDTKKKLFRVYGLEYLDGHFIGTYKNTSDDVIYTGFDNEASLLRAFLVDWANSEFHFISGWYVELFDIAYLTNRIVEVLSESDAKQLSPLRKIRQKTIRESYGQDSDKQTFRWLGCATLDYIDLFQKIEVTFKPKNWKLNTISKEVLNDTKVPYSGPLQELYLNNYQEFIDYNIHDVRLIVKMEEKKKFFELIFTLAHMMKSNVEEVFATVKPWSNLMYHSLKLEGVIPKLKGVSGISYDYVGGYVKPPKLGFSKWVVSFDLNSLYPHLMQQYNLGENTLIPYNKLPQELKEISDYFRVDRDVYHTKDLVQQKIDKNIEDTINKKINLDCLKNYNYGLTCAGYFFDNGAESIFNKLTKSIYSERQEARKTLNKLKKNKSDQTSLMSQLHNKQMALKLMMNSLYGAVANEYFTEYFDIRVAEAITSSGQRAIKWVSDRLNKHLNKVCGTIDEDYVVANDTDSAYLTLDPLVKLIFKEDADKPEKQSDIINFLDKVCNEKLQKVIDEAFVELADYTNAREQRMFMKREALAVSAIWTAKKRYAMLVADLEGERFNPYKVKFTGLEALRSDYPDVCQEVLVECYDELLKEKGVKSIRKIVKRFKQEHEILPLKDIASTTSANNVSNFIDSNGKPIKGTPNHIKATIAFNRLIEENNLNTIRPFNNGDKVQVAPLKRNPYGISEIAFDTHIPKELDIEKFVDRDTMFEKTFLNPLSTICEVCGIDNVTMMTKRNSMF